MIELVRAAIADYEHSAKTLCEVVAEEYPVDSVQDVRLGGHNLEICVTGHSSSWWYSPGLIYGINIDTGKRRKFMPADIRG